LVILLQDLLPLELISHYKLSPLIVKIKIKNMKNKLLIVSGLLVLSTFSCSKLDQKLQSSFTPDPGAAGNAAGFLNGTYNDMNDLIHGVGGLLNLQCNTSDESLVPTRGGDWDDNGDWRVMHQHTWKATRGAIIGAFNALGKTESDALSTLASSPTPVQADEAQFLLSLAQFYFVDLFGQVPYRTVAEYNSIQPAPVYQSKEAIDVIVANLNGIISRNLLPANKGRANINAAKFLLMKVLLNKGAFLNRTAPVFDNADMTQVITLGTQLMGAGYSLNTKYFNNFGPDNATTSTEAIWAWPNNGTSNIGGINSGNTNQRWMNTFHYNSWNKASVVGSAGWNGFSTVADFYNLFEGHGDGTPGTVIDTTKDQRIGGRFYPGVTDVSGIKPGFLAGQQYNADGTKQKDRQGVDLAFTPAVAAVETNGATLERTGIRVVKYPPDYANYNGGNQKNQFQVFRYADVVLMVAEAKLRLAAPDAAGALTLVNQLRTSRGATPWATITLVDPANVSNPNTLLAERGREMYWENWRRQDLIRFGMFLKPWALKTVSDPKELLFPIPSDQLIANPNLKQNPGY
jgi:starch-binding outer membrane protein, SusD/RagB family